MLLLCFRFLGGLWFVGVCGRGFLGVFLVVCLFCVLLVLFGASLVLLCLFVCLGLLVRGVVVARILFGFFRFGGTIVRL